MTKEFNLSVKDYVKERKAILKKKLEGINPTLAVIQVGNNPASNSYIKGKKKDCKEVGIKVEHIHLETATTSSLKVLISTLNSMEDVKGIIVQLPLPENIDVKEVQLAIDPKKDVDGFHPMSFFKPCTPLGVINYLKANDISFLGKNALVIGRSGIVGKPLAKMLLELDCTVTVAHSKTPYLSTLFKESDLVFTAIDKIEWFDYSYWAYLKSSEVVIDIGLGVSNRDNKLHGNISQECVELLNEHTRIISGMGGVGLLTRLQLLENTFIACGL